MGGTEKVSLIVLTHNALEYCRILFDSILLTRDVSYEVVVVDNRSDAAVRTLLVRLFDEGRINRLCLIDRNTYFAEGNNVGVGLSSRDSTHVLLLNSDVEIRDPYWLRKLLDIHRPGISAYGFVDDEPWARADGYCLLIERDIYRRYALDEYFQWFWSVTKLQADVLAAGYEVQAVAEHEELIHHFGGKSGSPERSHLRGMDLDSQQVVGWFGGRRVRVIDRLV